MGWNPPLERLQEQTGPQWVPLESLAAPGRGTFVIFVADCPGGLVGGKASAPYRFAVAIIRVADPNPAVEVDADRWSVVPQILLESRGALWDAFDSHGFAVSQAAIELRSAAAPAPAGMALAQGTSLAVVLEDAQGRLSVAGTVHEDPVPQGLVGALAAAGLNSLSLFYGPEHWNRASNGTAVASSDGQPWPVRLGMEATPTIFAVEDDFHFNFVFARHRP